MRKKKYCHFCGAGLTNKFHEGRTRRYCTSCRGPIYENPVPATCVIVMNNNDEVLLVKRSVPPKEGLWCLPGGFIELGEAPEASALRELKEETGLTGKIASFQGIVSTPNDLYDTVIIICYLVTSFSDTLTPGDDATEASFYNKDQFPEIAFKSHKQFIMNYFRKLSD